MRRQGFCVGVAVLALAVFNVGCPRETHRDHRNVHFTAGDYDTDFPHNLARVRCRQDTDGKPVVIELTATKQVLNDPLDRIVFVCRGDTVIWHANNPDLKFTVEFKDQTSVKELFELGGGTFKHDPAVPNPPAVEAPKQKVKSLIQDQLVDYAYSIKICCNAQHTMFEIDPHVIPMGK